MKTSRTRNFQNFLKLALLAGMAAAASPVATSLPSINHPLVRGREQQHVFTLNQVDSKPVLKKNAAKAVYPPELLKKKETGSATVAFVVTKKGAVEKVKTVTATNRAFGAAAEEAAAQWHYKPAKKGGSAVDCEVAVTIKFSIKENGAGDSDSPAGSESAGDSEN